MAADPLALTLLTCRASCADIAVAPPSFGMPLCNGGPHAAYMVYRDEFNALCPAAWSA
jgi:glycine dehydrogenase